jgi:endonuclease/exonuclease/phosphatase family metal-dependent hydrolase
VTGSAWSKCSAGHREAVTERWHTGSRSAFPVAIGWLVIAPLAVCAAADVAQLQESSTLLLLAIGLTPFLGVPALVALGIGLQYRHRVLTGVSAATAGVFLLSTLPGLGIPTGARPLTGTQSLLRLFSANVHFANPDIGWIAEEITATTPDVVALQEIDLDGAAGLRKSGALGRFPYAATVLRTGPAAIGLWSRFPLADVRVDDVYGMPFISATMVSGGRRLRVYTVHLIAPLDGDRVRWRAQLRWLDEELRRQPEPLVVSGDFNATRYHPSFRSLLSDRLGDAHERHGRGWAMTWPGDQWPLPPLMRIDHVLVSPDIGVRSVREGLGQGSDHRPIIADLVLP